MRVARACATSNAPSDSARLSCARRMASEAMLNDHADPGISLTVVKELEKHFGAAAFVSQMTSDAIPTLWVSRAMAHSVLDYLKTGIARPYRMLFDLTAIDERQRVHRQEQPTSDFTIVY